MQISLECSRTKSKRDSSESYSTTNIKKIPRKLFDTKISIDFFWNSRLDLDNHGYATKLIIDGLKGYLVKDDNRKYISKISHSFWNGKGVKIVISRV